MSPYGVDKKIGGDNKQNDTFMEKCVSGITGTNKRTGKPYSKGEKIAICKTSLKNKKSKSSTDDTVELEFILSAISPEIDMEEQFMTDCMTKMIENGKATSRDEALKLCQDTLDNNDSDLESSINYLTKLLS